MDKPTRVWKTLACLVGAMTGTTALLGWMDPSKPLFPVGLSHDDVVRMAKASVADGVVVDGARWSAIEIVPGSPGTPDATAGLMLAANLPPAAEAPPHSERYDVGSAHRKQQSLATAAYHFCISVDGLPRGSGQWAAQRSLDAPETIRIEVAQVRPGEPISPAQWFGLRALLAALDDGLSPSVPNHLRWGDFGGSVTGQQDPRRR